MFSASGRAGTLGSRGRNSLGKRVLFGHILKETSMNFQGTK